MKCAPRRADLIRENEILRDVIQRVWNELSPVAGWLDLQSPREAKAFFRLNNATNLLMDRVPPVQGPLRENGWF